MQLTDHSLLQSGHENAAIGERVRQRIKSQPARSDCLKEIRERGAHRIVLRASCSLPVLSSAVVQVVSVSVSVSERRAMFTHCTEPQHMPCSSTAPKKQSDDSSGYMEMKRAREEPISSVKMQKRATDGRCCCGCG